MAPDTSMHAYLLRTDHSYRDAFVAEVILRQAKLIELLALREGITFDANGDLEGVTEEEQRKLSAFIPAVNVTTVRDASPVHDQVIQQEVAALDPYAATPDPAVSFGSEKVDPESPQTQGQYLVNHGVAHDPNADIEEISDDQLASIEDGGYFPGDPALSPVAAVAAAEAQGAVVNPETVATDGDEPTGDADGDGDTEGADGYKAKTVDDLKDELKDRALPTSGSKAELIERLEKDDKETAESGS